MKKLLLVNILFCISFIVIAQNFEVKQSDIVDEVRLLGIKSDGKAVVFYDKEKTGVLNETGAITPLQSDSWGAASDLKESRLFTWSYTTNNKAYVVTKDYLRERNAKSPECYGVEFDIDKGKFTGKKVEIFDPNEQHISWGVKYGVANDNSHLVFMEQKYGKNSFFYTVVDQNFAKKYSGHLEIADISAKFKLSSCFVGQSGNCYALFATVDESYLVKIKPDNSYYLYKIDAGFGPDTKKFALNELNNEDVVATFLKNKTYTNLTLFVTLLNTDLKEKQKTELVDVSGFKVNKTNLEKGDKNLGFFHENIIYDVIQLKNGNLIIATGRSFEREVGSTVKRSYYDAHIIQLSPDLKKEVYNHLQFSLELVNHHIDPIKFIPNNNSLDILFRNHENGKSTDEIYLSTARINESSELTSSVNVKVLESSGVLDFEDGIYKPAKYFIPHQYEYKKGRSIIIVKPGG